MEKYSTERLEGREVVALMRKHKKTIAGLAFAMGITRKRIRQVRAEGLDDKNAIRDWLEAITGQDPGPLPERYRISGRREEGDCCNCGCPLFNGEYAYEYAGGMYCCIGCCREANGFGKSESVLSQMVDAKRDQWAQEAELNFARRGRNGEQMHRERWANGSIMVGHAGALANQMVPLERAIAIEQAGWKIFSQ